VTRARGAVRSPWALVRRAQLAWALVTLLVVAAPAAFGPALDPVLRLLGQAGHVCQCGMEPGTCGCPECAKLARQRLAEQPRDAAPSLEKACAQNAAIRMAALPTGVTAAGPAALRAPRGERVPMHRAPAVRAGTDVEPPTPPPRLA
jgi:hypothetical protein